MAAQLFTNGHWQGMKSSLASKPDDLDWIKPGRNLTMDIFLRFSSEAKYIRLGQFWVVLYFLFTATPWVPLVPSSNCCVCIGWRQQLWGDVSGSPSLCRDGGVLEWAVDCGLRVWGSLRHTVWGFLFTSLVILSFTTQVHLFFSPFLPVLSTVKLFRRLIGPLFCGPFLRQLRVGFLQCFPSYLRWRTTLLFPISYGLILLQNTRKNWITRKMK